MEKKIDPGWNDPPMLNYSSSNPPPKSRITNKRIAFPLGGNNSNITSSQSLPPTSLPPNLPISSTLTSTALKLEELPAEQDLLKAVKENFEKILLNNNNLAMNESIRLLYKIWDEGKFTKDCKKNIYLLTKLLVENNKTDAQQIKEKLLVEFKDICEEWLNNIII